MAQELLPTASSQFASAGYWTRFFETRQGRAFEWCSVRAHISHRFR